MINRAQTFIKNRDEVWGQDQLEGAIQEIVSSEGKFVCLLGGKNTGKSLLIENMEQRSDKILLVNLREEGNDILKGLYAFLGETEGYNVQEHLVCLLNDMNRRVGAKVTVIIDHAYLAFTISPDTKVEDTMALRNALALFTMLTKEKNEV